MSETKPEVGEVAWSDLTVADAEGVRDFYAAVVGWTPEAAGIGDYSDYTMCALSQAKA